MLSRKIRVAVIGVGNVARRHHIPAYLCNRNVNLVALVDVDRKKVERAAKRFGVKKFFLSPDELFEKEDIEAVSVCTPPDTHARVVLEALSHGAHVLCEKPLATTVDDGKKMVKASRVEERILMVGFHRRFIANYQRAHNFISRGRAGHVYCVEDHMLQPSPLLEWGKSPWLYQAGVGGVLAELGPHVFDMLNYVFGDLPVSISAFSSTHLDSPVDEYCLCALQYPEEKIGIGVVSWLESTVVEYLNLHGTAQSLFLSPKLFVEINPTDLPEVSLLRKLGKLLISQKLRRFSVARASHSKEVNPYLREIDYFIGQIMEDKKSSPSAMDGLNVLITCEAAKIALKTRRRMQISTIRPV